MDLTATVPGKAFPANNERKKKACESCALSKIKCTWLNDQICQRCLKSNFKCTVPAPRARAKRGKSRRVASLEQRVDGIMSLLAEHRLLQKQKNPSQSASSYIPDSKPDNCPPSVGNEQTSMPNQIVNDRYTVPRPTSNAQHVNRLQCIDIVSGLQMSVEEANQALKEYKEDFVPQFPFIPVSHCHVYDMYKEQPVLLKTILLTCRHQSYRARAVGDKWFREFISNHVVLLNEKRLELLQAILVFIAWKDFNFFLEGYDINFLQLAVGLHGALGLHRSPPDADKAPKTLLDAAAVLPGRDGINTQPRLSNADRRTALGLFYVVSVISNLLGRIPALEYTTHLDQCFNELLNSGEYETDYHLVQVIRLQRLSAKARRLVLETGQHQMTHRLHTLAITAIHKELDEVMGRLPERLKSNQLLSSHYHNVLVQIYEPAIYESANGEVDDTFSRPRRMWKCLEHAKSFYEAFLLTPPETLSVMPFVMTAHLGFTNVIIARLLMLDGPEWYASTARQAVDFPDIIRRMVTLYEAGDHASGLRRRTMENGQGFLAMYAEKLDWARSWYCSKVSNITAVSGNATSIPLISPDTEMFSDAELWQILFDPDYEGVVSTA